MTNKKGADILLIYPPHRKITYVSSIPHLSAYAKKKGFKVDALDAPTLGLSIKDIIDYIEKTKPKSVGVSIPFTPLATSGLLLLSFIKRTYPDMPLIVGGVHPTICPDEFKKYAYVCIGTGERALVVFLEWINKPSNEREYLDPILNIHTPVNEIESPDWNIVGANKYKLYLPTGERGFPMQTSLGCIFNCVFCSSNILFKDGIRYKSIIQIDKEINKGIKLFNTRFIIFRCENFTLNKERFKEICSYLKKNKISWWAQTRANLIDEENAQMAFGSGCIGFSIGIETGDSYVMKMLKKGITLEDGEKAFKVLKKVGLRSCANFMIGHVWDTIYTVKRTLEYANKIDPDYFGVQIATPFPGTEFRKIVLERGEELKKDWHNYDTSRVNYVPIGLYGLNLLMLRREMELHWFLRKPKRFLIILRGKQGLRNKLRFIRRMLTIYKKLVF